MKPVDLQSLAEIAGREHLLTSIEDRICYGYDSQHVESLPDAVVCPADAHQIAEVLKLANESGFHVVPRGAGTGLSGGSVPITGGVVLDLSRLKRIAEVNPGNLTATVEAGVVTASLAAAAEKAGLLYPPDPGSIKVCTIGGNVAENAGGLRAIKYGVTSDYLMSLEAVTSGGEIFKTGARTHKSVAGYDLTSLLCGSEGTLAVVTSVTVRLVPLPKHRRSILATFLELPAAAQAVANVMAAGVVPCTLEIMDRTTIRAIEDFKKIGLPLEAGAMLLAEVDGTASAAVEEEAATVRRVIEEAGAESVEFAADSAARERVWEARRSALAALARVRPTTILEDVTVPLDRLAEMVSIVEKVARKYSLLVGTFGHAGDGNLHPTFLTDQRDPDETTRVEEAVGEIFIAAIDLGGTVSGEHGIGFAKSRFLPIEVGAPAMEVMRRIKHALDPNGILNPGKVFDSQVSAISFSASVCPPHGDVRHASTGSA
ncbi:MAG: FAD-binding protein [Armatimonadetes bacterium]|nr:FAD-binding protein [Armatimonadota bacterium]